MSRHHWYANGYELTADPAAVKVLLSSGMSGATAQRGENQPVGGRDGRDWVEKPYDEASFTLSVRVVGSDHAAAMATYRRIVAEAKRRHALTLWKHELPDGSSFECDGEVTVAIAPVWQGSDRVLLFALDVTVPDGSWRDTADIDTGLIPIPGPFPQTIGLTGFAGASAPMGDLVVEVHGQADNPHVTDETTGRGFTYAATVPDLDTLTVDSGADDITLPAGGTLDAFTYDGARMLEVTPNADPAIAPQIVVSCTSVGANAALRVTGRRHYLLG